MESFLIRSQRFLGPTALILLAIAMYGVYQVPREAEMGLAYKILYVHVPSVFPAYLGFLLAAIGGLGFLITGRDGWDRMALASGEVGVLFCTLLIVTGPLWARPIWGVWWDWNDLRLSTTAILWFIYLGYLFLRSFADGDFMRRTSAVVAIAGLVAIPFVRFAIELAKIPPIHPPNPDLPIEMKVTLRLGYLVFFVLFFYLLGMRLAVARAEAEAEAQLEALDPSHELA